VPPGIATPSARDDEVVQQHVHRRIARNIVGARLPNVIGAVLRGAVEKG
jgi:hypothetical protein